MKRLMQTLWLTAAAVALLVAPAAEALAQGAGPKPVAVVSLAPVDKILGDIDYLTRTAGAADAGRIVTLMAGPYIDGLDRTKPAGSYVVLDGEMPVVIAFVPTKDLTKVLATLKDQVGEPMDVGGGVQQLGDKPTFLKQEGGYTFVAQNKDHLVDLPKDPVGLLGGLHGKYTVAAKFNVANVPQQHKDRLIEEMKQGFENAPIDTDDPEQREIAEKTGRNVLNQMIRLIDESNEITFGWAIDPAGKTTYFDLVYTAKEGTQLAKEMAALKDAKTNFAGFLLPDAAMTLNFSGTITDKAQIEQSLAMIDTMKGAMLKELEKDDDLEEDEIAALKEFVGELMEVFKATIKTGKSDGGAVALAEPNALTFVAGLHLADAPRLEAAVKKAVTFAQKKHADELKDVEIKFDAGKLGPVRLHKINFPVADDDAQKVFGETLDLIVGISDNSAYVAMGSKAEETLKKVVDQSAAEPNKAVPPAQMTIAIGPFLKFAQSVEDNAVLAALVSVADRVKGNDRVMINVTPISNGEVIRYELEEGVLQIIGEGARAAQNAANGL